MDLGTIFGILVAFGLILWSMTAGATLDAFIDVPSFVVVIGGATCALFISTGIRTIKKLGGIASKAMFYKPESAKKLIDDLVSYAEIARRDGILSLEAHCKDIEDPFIVQGIQMAVDGTDPELIEAIMDTELENLMDRHTEGKGILDTLTKYAPSFGMIGTLIGLVAMLANMSDPSSIGTGMAIALLTTLYGSVAANVVFDPMADKLSRRSAEEVVLKSIVIKGVMSIQSGDNPRVVEQKLKTFIPPSERVDEEEDSEAA